MLRHEIALNPVIWTAAGKPVKRLKGRWPADGWQVLQHPDGVIGRFRVALTARVLELAGEINEPRGWDVSQGTIHPEWYFRDHVAFLLDPDHDHTTRRMVAVVRNGDVRTEDGLQFQGEEPSDVLRWGLKLAPLQPDVQVTETGHGWRVVVQIRRSRLSGAKRAKANGTPLGLQIRLGAIGATIRPACCWPEAGSGWGDGPFGFGDVVERGAALAVTGVDFGKPVWKTGDVTSRLRLNGQFMKRAARQGLCRVDVVGTDGQRDSTCHPWRARGRQVRIDVPVNYPFASKWAPDNRKTARLEISLLDPAGKALWRAGYPFGFDSGIIVREPFGLLGRPARRPQADDTAFVGQYRAWLLRTLPAWRWTTTRDGAPSDFTLRARRRDDDLDLMSPAVFGDLARLIHRRFDDWQDALCAASMALHHPCLTVHSSSWSRIAGMADGATVLRLGGCFCSDTARVAAILAEELGRLYGVPLKGFTLGLRGHISGLIETPLGDVLIDPMLGIYYHTLDNQRLATLEEMHAEPRIAQRMWSLPFASDGVVFFGGSCRPLKQPWRNMPLAYPPGKA